MTSESAPFLLVDDDDLFRSRLGRALADRGFEVLQARDGNEALATVAARRPSRVLVDLRMPGMSGLDLVAELRKLDTRLTIVVLTGYGSIATALEAVGLGAAHYLTKPVDADEVLRVFSRLDQPATATPGTDEPTTTPSLARAEWEHINRVLADCGGNISKAARLLGLHRRSLQRKLAKYPTER